MNVLTQVAKADSGLQPTKDLTVKKPLHIKQLSQLDPASMALFQNTILSSFAWS